MITALLFALLAAPPEVVVTTLDGATLEGPLTALSAESATLAEDQSVPVASLQSIEAVDASPRPLDDAALTVGLADGSDFVGESVTLDGSLRLTMPGGDELAIERRVVRSLRLAVLDEAVRAAWMSLLDERRRDDLLIVRKGDTLDFIACAIGEISNEAIAIRVGSRDAKVPRERAFGLIFADVEKPSDAGLARVTLAGGDRIVVSAVTLDGEMATLRPVAADAKLSRPASEIVEIDYARGRVVRLATLEPAARYERAERVFSGNRPVRVGRNVLELPPMLEGRVDPSSVWMHSGTTATYRLPRGAERLQATAGIDEIEGADVPAAPVDVTVSGDGDELWSGPIEPDAITKWDLPLDGVRQLTIAVDGRTPDGIREHLVLFGARIVTE